jgi:hypothetical protein
MMAEQMKKMAEQKKKTEAKEAEKKKNKKEAKEAMMAEKEKKKEAKEALKTVLLPVQEHLLIKSDTNKTGLKGVQGEECASRQRLLPSYMQHSRLHQPLFRQLRHPRGGSSGVPAAPGEGAPAAARRQEEEGHSLMISSPDVLTVYISE